MFATLDPSLLLATATTIDIRRCNICKAQISLHSPWKRCDGCRSKKAAEHRKWRDGKKDRLSLLPVCSTVPLKRKSEELKINGPSKRPKAQSNGKAMQQQDCPEYCQFHPIWMPVSLSQMYEELGDLPQKQELCLHASHSIVASPDVDHLQRARMVVNGLQRCQFMCAFPRVMSIHDRYTLL
ncbi:hypothetical protein ARMGADRAFT_1085737 [Armillaria gallica]|uniref:Uncharacterized protein n=1 Tax=Armillaria gallica TaxID=47427 RepID=A0A2H3CWC9_ARMGA|nr:hypothetical protein ARMGADRAFT_1085737 [Armillaria gallica]